MKTYSLILNDIQSGYYRSRVPYVSARKIFRNVVMEMIKNNVHESKKSIEFEFDIINVENQNKYKYHGSAHPCDEEKTFVKYGEKRIVKINYVYVIKRIYFW